MKIKLQCPKCREMVDLDSSRPFTIDTSDLIEAEGFIQCDYCSCPCHNVHPTRGRFVGGSFKVHHSIGGYIAFTIDTLDGFYVVQPYVTDSKYIVVRNEVTELPIIIERITHNEETIYKGWVEGQATTHTNFIILVCKIELLKTRRLIDKICRYEKETNNE